MAGLMASVGKAFGSAFSIFGGANRQRDAARQDLSEFSGWSPGIRYGGASNKSEWDLITGRARDLDENNGWINGGLDRRVESVVGGNIRLAAQPVYSLLNRDYSWRMAWAPNVEARFRVWGNDVEHRNDAKRRLTFGAQAKLAYLTYARDGEAAAEIRDNKRGLSNTTNVLLVEPERISNPQDRAFVEGPNLRNGIQFDGDGAAIGYWVRSGHPADPNPGLANVARWEYIPARGPTGRAKFIHVYSPRRIEQNRGISKLAEVMVPAKMLDRVDRAEVEAALKAALLSIFIKSPGTTDDLESGLAPAGPASGDIDPWINAYLNYREKAPIRVDSASVVHLLPDEDVVAPATTHPNSNYAQFAEHILRKIASSLGIGTPQMSGDWSGINYSSARALLNEIWRSFEEDRFYFAQHFLTPIYAAWLEIEVANGDVIIPGGPLNFYKRKTEICMCEWIGPSRGSVDPQKEAGANNLDIAAGRKSTVQAIMESGRDPVDVIMEEAWFLEQRQEAGLSAPNFNVKADAGSASDGGDTAGGTAEDRDGDGKPLEDKAKKKTGAPA